MRITDDLSPLWGWVSRRRTPALGFLLLCLAGTPVRAVAQQLPPSRVWVNTASHVYHCPGTRHYGATNRGEYLLESEAVARGNRAAGGKGCDGLATVSPSAERVGVAAQGTSRSIEATKVWVNRKSGVYHCPGTRYYGATKSGEYMMQVVAQTAGYRPAYGKTCS